MSLSNSLVQQDLSSHIHPFTNLARHQEVGLRRVRAYARSPGSIAQYHVPLTSTDRVGN